ncbi:hypothetical protein FPOA_07114 [Fusarium poae]|uniref:RING-type domain-containing protein n=1 Tax=Fusarium poae TaxID=36050 RepID=A0A1B8AKD0_FUSPO|nr:hypothetical protein FPOA_07114 [Fusarium poae]
MSATTSPTMSDMRTEVNWPVLKSYLEQDKVAFEDLELPCGVCHDTMTVLPHQHEEDEDGKSHNAIILPCGHIFGKACFEAAFDQSSSLRPVCFICRADLTFPECGHIHRGLPLPSSKESISSIPDVISKDGLMAPTCGGCLCDETSQAFCDHASEVNNNSSGDEYLMYGCQVAPTSEITFRPFDSDLEPEENGVVSLCETPREVMWALKRFEERNSMAESGMHWFDDATIGYKWQFYKWAPYMSMPSKPAFNEGKCITIDERTPLAEMFWDLMKKGDDDLDEDDEE